ncbi:hypothetical protein Scep_017590 [Stephania cephalantha]|uniref:Glutathione S-transferase n=1 Tax=Stephania cephalantha TaxID=152367 RepID=A0AAP0NTP4_9MAGN
MAASDEVKIIGLWPSPFVMRPRIALNLKSVAHHNFEEIIGNKSDVLLKSNPVYKKIFPSLSKIAKSWGRDEEALEQAKTAMELMEKAFRDCSKGNEFFNGDQIGYLDIAFGSNVGWIRTLETMHGFTLINDEKTPGLAGWAERFWAHEAVKDVNPSVEKLIEFSHEVFTKPPPSTT